MTKESTDTCGYAFIGLAGRFQCYEKRALAPENQVTLSWIFEIEDVVFDQQESAKDIAVKDIIFRDPENVENTIIISLEECDTKPIV